MSHKDNQDLRVRGNGGWGWFEHELFTVFAPIIGPAGVSVYAAMARLIPLAAIDSDKAVRVRRVSEYSCVGRSKCAEEMRQIIALGMVIETKYLDGREPTYKLASLNELAKLGQKELLDRIGVRNTDTAPFDQKAKHSRERALRDEKLRETSASEALTRELPLLDDEKRATTDGVRHADTPGNGSEEANGVRPADTVSAKSPPVSAKSGFVSAKTAFVSAGADTFKEEIRVEEIFKNPLPPAGQGEVGIDSEKDDPDQARPGVPECTFGDAGFDLAATNAASWVLAELGISKRRLLPTIEAQLRLHCRNSRSSTVADAAAFMAKQGRAIHADAELMRHRPWGWERFFAEGHWSRPLPYDHAKRRASEATVGMAKAQPRDEWAGVPAFVEANAVLLDAAGLTDHAARLRDLATQSLPLDELDTELSKVEESTVDVLFATMTDDERRDWRDRALLHMRHRRGQMNQTQFEAAISQLVKRYLLEARRVPKLSIFYIPRT